MVVSSESFKCAIYRRDGKGKGKETLLVEGVLLRWPNSVRQSRSHQQCIKLVVDEKQWPTVKDALLDFKPNEDSNIPKDFEQHILDINMPSKCTLVPSWNEIPVQQASEERARAKLDRSRNKKKDENETEEKDKRVETVVDGQSDDDVSVSKNKKVPPSSKKVPQKIPLEEDSGSETECEDLDKEIAARKAEEEAKQLSKSINEVTLEEPPHIPESEFRKNNPHGISFKFPTVENPSTDSANARVEWVAKAEVVAEQRKQKLSNTDDECEEEDEDEEGEEDDTKSISIEEEQDDDAVGKKKDEDPLWADDEHAWSDDAKIKAKANILHPRKKRKAAREPVDEKKQDDAEPKGERKRKTSKGDDAEPKGKKKRKTSQAQEDEEDGLNEDPPESESDSDDSDDDSDASEVEKITGIYDEDGAYVGPARNTISHYVSVPKSTKDVFDMKGKSDGRKAGARPKTAAQQLDGLTRKKLAQCHKRLLCAQRMSTPIARSDSFDHGKKSKKYKKERQEELAWPTVCHMMGTLTYQAANGDGQTMDKNKDLGVKLAKRPMLLLCCGSAYHQSEIELALKAGNLDIRTYNNFDVYVHELGSKVVRDPSKPSKLPRTDLHKANMYRGPGEPDSDSESE